MVRTASWCGIPLGVDVKVSTLKKRSEFLRVRGGASWGTEAFLLQAKLREGGLLPAAGQETEAQAEAVEPGRGVLDGPRFGFTVTKKIGNAVVRNRIRRRFKAALGELSPAKALPGCDYVVVARRAAASREFIEVVSDFAQALDRVHHLLRNPGRKRRR